ncbi:hypothetical protein ScPMuIL_014251 [Solemya velum]
MDQQSIKSAPLFPSALTLSGPHEQAQPLFPITGFPQAAVHCTDEGQNLDFLTNKSYTSKAAQEAEKFFKQEIQLEVKDDGASRERLSPELVWEKHKRHHGDYTGDNASSSKIHKKSKHKHKHKHKKEEHRESKVKVEVQRTEVPNPTSKSKVFLEEVPGLTPEHAYRIDRHSDTSNWTFGSIYKLHIAKHHRLRGCCLGLGRTGQTEMFNQSKSSKPGVAGRYFSRENRRLLKNSPEERIPVSHERSSDFCLSESPFIPTEPDKPQVTDEYCDIRQKLMDPATSAYIKGQRIRKEPSTPDDSEMTIVKDEDSQLIESYNRKLRQNPHDIQTWFEFVKFQDRLRDKGLDSQVNVKEKHKNTALAVLEKKIAILEKAMEENPACIELKLKYFQLCQEIWEGDRINKELEKLLFVYPANELLWKHYLVYNQSHLSFFTVTRVTKLYHKCLKTLIGISEGNVHAHDVPKDLPKQILDIFLQYCNFLRQAGHSEKALATFQALIEFNFFCPPSLESSPHADRVAVFESFWDSGVPRSGEEGAIGWRNWLEKQNKLEHSPVDNDGHYEEAEESIIAKHMSKCRTWLEIETLRESFHWLPWRPDLTKNETEEDCEDVERLVLFDDLEPMLFTLPGNAAKFDLVLQFMVFLGVDINFIIERNISNQLPEIQVERLEQLDVSPESVNLKMDSPISETVYEFISTLFQQMMKYFDERSNNNLKKSDIKELKKFAKGLLKEKNNRNNLSLWAAYIELERSIGKPEEVAAILETALCMFSGTAGQTHGQRAGIFLLYRMYSEFLLNFKPCDIEISFDRQTSAPPSNVRKVLQILLCAVEESKFIVQDVYSELTPTQCLKTRKKFTCILESFENDFSTVAADDITKYFYELSLCYALFELCSSGIDASCRVYNTAVDISSKAITEQEDINVQGLSDNRIFSLEKLHKKLFMAELRTLMHHMTTNNCSLSKLRNVLDKALQKFPYEQSFLHLFVSVEERAHIAGRVQRFFTKILSNSLSYVPIVFAWLAESRRQKLLEEQMQEFKDQTGGLQGVSVRVETGVIHRLRTVLERALAEPSLTHCILLWRLYIQTEFKFGHTEKAKGVLYRALQQCPWSKMFGDDQLQELVDLMMEKEIRVQIPVEELDL